MSTGGTPEDDAAARDGNDRTIETAGTAGDEARSIPLTRRVVERLSTKGLTLASAESLTAGLVSAGIADIPGASAVLRGAAVTYATETKADVLGVDAALLAERGAVDADVARAMAVGVLWLFGSDLGVATTGVAGPSEQDGQPVGTCFVAVAHRGESPASPGRCTVEEHHFSGDRSAIRHLAAQAAWQLVLDEV